MLLRPRLIEARLERRYKRFLADVRLPCGNIVTAHCANPGAMIGLAQPNARVWLAPNLNAKAKLPWRWILEAVDDQLVVIHTGLANRIVHEALEQKQIPSLTDYSQIKPEFAIENSRIDFRLSQNDQHCFVEVKSLTLKLGNQAAFPDSVTKRGVKHLDTLINLRAQGHRAVLFWLVMRQDCLEARAAPEYDPAYAAKLHEACKAGVETLAYQCAINTDAITLGEAIPLPNEHPY